MNNIKKYPIYDLSHVLATGAVEQMGGKPKEWVTYAVDGRELRILFKEGRSGTGENWAEKVTSELAKLIGLPHAVYDFGYLGADKFCVISPKFIKEGESLVAGNQLIEGFDTNKRFKNTTYTLNAIFSALEKNEVCAPIFLDEEVIKNGQDLLIGYLCFDAWIGNTDRHDENWAIIVNANNVKRLAPTYDHASSLGRNESDANRIKRMTTNDKGFNVNAYIKRAMTPIYDENGKKLNTISVAQECKKHNSKATKFWIRKILDVMNDETSIKIILDKVPQKLISEPAKNFAFAMLKENAELLKGLEND